MLKCFRCDETFDKPSTKRITENIDGENGWWTYFEEYCPYCGSEDIDEAAED